MRLGTPAALRLRGQSFRGTRLRMVDKLVCVRVYKRVDGDGAGS